MLFYSLEIYTFNKGKELQEAFEKLPNEPVAPVKYMRSQAPKPGQLIAQATVAGIFTCYNDGHINM